MIVCLDLDSRLLCIMCQGHEFEQRANVSGTQTPETVLQNPANSTNTDKPDNTSLSSGDNSNKRKQKLTNKPTSRPVSRPVSRPETPRVPAPPTIQLIKSSSSLLASNTPYIDVPSLFSSTNRRPTATCTSPPKCTNKNPNRGPTPSYPPFRNSSKRCSLLSARLSWTCTATRRFRGGRI
jgi:hypothetical protein